MILPLTLPNHQNRLDDSQTISSCLLTITEVVPVILKSHLPPQNLLKMASKRLFYFCLILLWQGIEQAPIGPVRQNGSRRGIATNEVASRVSVLWLADANLPVQLLGHMTDQFEQTVAVMEVVVAIWLFVAGCLDEIVR